jgi:putative peptide zinc metalloprotease protein
MSTCTPETTTTERPASLRARPDLVTVRQRWRGKSVWAVQDPLARRHYHLSEHEWSILQWLDGQTSLAEVRRRFEARFAPLRLGGEQLQGFLAMLADEGLLLVDAPNQAERLQSRRQREQRGRRAQALLNVLSIRLPGFNPERLLEWLYPPLAWLFSPLCVAVWLLLAAGTAVSLAVNWSEVTARLPGLAELAAPANWFWVLATLAVIKLLHELGHALAMRHFGGRCREMGLMLLVFTPSLYTNVSDSWMLESRWRRIAVAAAGMYVELMLATVATLVWWWTQPGLLNTLCLSTMLICSLGTVLLNGNPLMRFDGYYILADLVEVPNLAEQAGAWLRRTAARWLLGVELPEHPALNDAPRKLLAGYAIASTAYRWLLIVGVLWGLNHLLAAWRLEALGVLLTAVVLASLVLPTALAAATFVRQPLRRGRWRPWRAIVSGLFVAGLAAAILWLPVPMNVTAPALVEYAGAKSVFVEVAGELAPRVKVGQQVRRGELLARLTNRDMTLELARLTGQRERTRQRLAALEARRLSDPTQGELVPSTRASLADLEERLRQLRQDIARLELTAPASGTVLPAPPQDAAG